MVLLFIMHTADPMSKAVDCSKKCQSWKLKLILQDSVLHERDKVIIKRSDKSDKIIISDG